MTPLQKRFTAVVEREPSRGGWAYVVMPDSAVFLRYPRSGLGPRDGRRASVPQLVYGAGRGPARAPMKTDLRTRIGKDVGDTVTVVLQERLGS